MDSAELHKPLTGNSLKKEKWTFHNINRLRDRKNATEGCGSFDNFP